MSCTACKRKVQTRTTIATGNGRYTFNPKRFIKHISSNTLYQIQFTSAFVCINDENIGCCFDTWDCYSGVSTCKTYGVPSRIFTEFSGYHLKAGTRECLIFQLN